MTSALPLVAALAAGAVSSSDLGVTVAGGDGQTSTLLAACPATLRLGAGLAPAEAAALAASYSLACAGGLVAVELPAYQQGLPASVTDAQAQADAYWLSLPVAALRASVPASSAPLAIGPAGFDASPSWRSGAAGVPFAAAFWGRLAANAAADGRTLLVPVTGVPAARFGESQSAFCAVLSQAAGIAPPSSLGWAFGGEATLLAKDRALEADAFGFERLDTECGFFFPFLVEIRAAGGWRSRTTAAGWLDWLAFYDAQFRALPASSERQGLTVFGAGARAGEHDLSPLADDFATYLRDPAIPPPGSGGSPGTIGGGGGGGTNGPGAGLDPGGQDRGGCGNAGGALALLVLAPFVLPRRATRR